MFEPDDSPDVSPTDAERSTAPLPGLSSVPLTPAGRHRAAGPDGPQPPVVEAWARMWLEAVWPGVDIALSRNEARNALRRLATSLLTAARADRFDAEGVRRVGSHLVACRFTAPDTLGLTQDMALRHLAAIGVGVGRIGELLRELAVGYVSAHAGTILAEQELLRDLWIRTRSGDNDGPRTVAAPDSRFHEAFHHSSAGLCLLDADGEVIEANAAFAVLIGRDPADCQFLPLQEAVDKRDAARLTDARRRIVGGRAGTVETVVRCPQPDGHQARLRLTLTALADRGTGENAVILITAADASREDALAELLAAGDELRDPVTYLPNRAGFRHEIATAPVDRDHYHHVCGIHLDDFAAVNAAVGDTAGDVVLREAADRLNRAVGDHGFLARLTGTTFGVLLEREAHSHQIARLLRALHDAFSTPIRVAGHELSLTTTIAPVTVKALNADQVVTLLVDQLRRARTAMSSTRPDDHPER